MFKSLKRKANPTTRMSIRPDRVQQQACTFSLSDYVGQTTATHTPETRPMFNLSGITQHGHQIPSQPNPAASAAKLSFTLKTPSLAQEQQQKPLPNLTFGQNKTTSCPVASLVKVHRDPGSEIMRLCGLLEDQKQKLDTSTQRLTAAEVSVARANQTLTSERTAAAARVAQLSAELRSVRDTERQLRRELATSPATTELERQRAAFKIHAEGALRMEEQYSQLQATTAEAEAALAKLRDDHAALVAEHEASCALLEQTQAHIESTAAFSHEAEQATVATEGSAVVGADEAKGHAGVILAMKLAADERVASAVSAAIEAAAAEKVEAIAAEHDAHVTAVEALVADHSSKQSLLEDLLLKAREEVASTNSEAERMRLQIAGTEAPLPPAARTKLNSYTEARARLVALEKAADTTTIGSCRLAAARREVNDMFDELATGVQRRPPMVTAHVSNAAILARWKRRSVAQHLDRAIAVDHVPLDAAIACCDHENHTSVVITAADFESIDLGPTTASRKDESSEKQVQEKKQQPAQDLTTQQGRMDAAVVAISLDLKKALAVRKSFYKEAMSIPS